MAFFRDKFTVNRSLYERYYQDIKHHAGFSDKVAGVAGQCGPTSQPLRIKLLAALMRFTIIATMAKIGAGVLERFYYAYAEYCASPLVFKHSVHPPKNQQELTEVLYKSKMMGTPGIITWMDGATYDWLACPAALKNLCRDKSGNTSVMFNISADTTCIQHVYGPDYGGRNDKTAARMDNWALAIHNGLVFDGIDYASFSMASIMERSPTSCTIRQAH